MGIVRYHTTNFQNGVIVQCPTDIDWFTEVVVAKKVHTGTKFNNSTHIIVHCKQEVLAYSILVYNWVFRSVYVIKF